MTEPTLEELYNDPERAARIDEIERQMLAEDVRHVYFQYVTMQGRVLAKVVPTGFWAKAARTGLAWPYVVAGGFHVTRDDRVLGPMGGGTTEGLMLPDLETFAVLPWDRRMARVFCTHYRRLEEDVAPGQPVMDDCRYLLKRALRQLRQETGLTALSGCEPEMSWFRGPDQIDASDTQYPDWWSPGYTVRHLDGLAPVLTKVTEYGKALGFDMIQADYEDPSQLECNFSFDDFLTTADRLVTYRQICIQVAKELGMVATFMPKPVPGIMANGCHHHVSFWRDGENVMVDPAIESRRNLSEVGLHAVGGLLAHQRGMMALLAPTVNSYKRYLDAIWSPSSSTWGYDNRACALRVVPGRVEVRTPDSCVNPYLSHVAILAAVRHGWKQKVDPGPAQVGDQVEEHDGPTFAGLPITLAEAVDAFEADTVIRGALPSSVAETFIEAKRDEWLRYCGAITDWDLETYLNYIP